MKYHFRRTLFASRLSNKSWPQILYVDFTCFVFNQFSNWLCHYTLAMLKGTIHSSVTKKLIKIQQTNSIVKRWFTILHCAFRDILLSSFSLLKRYGLQPAAHSLAPGKIVLGSPVRLLPVMCHLKALWNLPSWLREPNNNKSALCATCSTHLGGFKYAGVMAPIPSVWCNTDRKHRRGVTGLWGILGQIRGFVASLKADICLPVRCLSSFPRIVKEQTGEWQTLASLRHPGGVFLSLWVVMVVMRLCLALRQREKQP